MNLISPPDGHYFFGYYNLCPWLPDGKSLLAHKASYLDHFPVQGDVLELGLLNPDQKTFHPLATSKAWNFQQGAKFQWFTGINNQVTLAYNDVKEGDAVTVLSREDGTVVRVLPKAFYRLSPNGTSALTFNYHRINLCRPEYGYPALGYEEKGLLPDDRDGIWSMDLETGKSDLILSLEDVIHFEEESSGRNCRHYLIHAVFNPSGTRFLFLHRFEKPDGITHTRLFTANVDGADLRLLMTGMISHFDWFDETTIFAWSGNRKLLSDTGRKSPKSLFMQGVRPVLKPVYYALGKPRFLMVRIVGDSYHFIQDKDPSECTPFAKGLFLTDGHCTFSNSDQAQDRWLLTDGYPDKKGELPLYLCNLSRDSFYQIGSFFCPKELDGPIRVDLHPRFSPDLSKVCVDTVHDGRRAMAIVDVSSLIR